jgi:hypothetical protein
MGAVPPYDHPSRRRCHGRDRWRCCPRQRPDPGSRFALCLQLRLQLADLRAGGVQCLVLQHGALHQQVAGIRLACKCGRDHAAGLRIFRDALHLRELREKLLQGLAFLWGHHGNSFR